VREMTGKIAYTCPFVPPELIAACGLEPWRVVPSVTKVACCPTASACICPHVRAFLGEARSAHGLAAIILTTRCDQMRRAGDLIAGMSGGSNMGAALPANLRLFLMNVPSTWQTAAARDLYRAELERLLRFLRGCGGRLPTGEQLAAVCHCRVGSAQGVDVRMARPTRPWHTDPALPPDIGCTYLRPSRSRTSRHQRVPLAILGGPLLREDCAVWSIIERAGGRIVLDATENGERTQPAPLDADRLREDPMGELARAYFDAIPDVFRRPNTLLYDWLSNQIELRGINGILLYRHVWCDLWHAEVHRLKNTFQVPILDLEMGDADAGRQDRTATRLQAFLEALK
jgi:hypothetical protein